MEGIDYKSLPIHFTHHAVERIKERFNIPRKAIQSLLEKAVQFGEAVWLRDAGYDEQTLSVLHNDRLFKFVLKENGLLCTTAHPRFIQNDTRTVMAKGKHLQLDNRQISNYKHLKTKLKDTHETEYEE